MDSKKNHLDVISDVYNDDNLFTLENRLMIEHYARLIAEKHTDTGKSCLDLGLGHGVAATILSRTIEDYTVIEGSKTIIDEYKNHNKDTNATIIQSYFEDFETDKRYDIIVMGFILEHVENPLEILNKYKRFLKESGIICISLPNFAQLNRRIGQLMGVIQTMEFFTDNDIDLGHKHLFDVESFKALISSADLKLLSLEGIYMKPITTVQIKQLDLGKDFLKALITIGKDYPELSVAMFAAATK
jgi:2-polyprenyl-3-methyl-5-hydroxy-6-metoxy-1,4-benzoquinol methylase